MGVASMKETADNSVQTLASVQTERTQHAAANRVASTIQQASRKTGVSFSYLMAQAGKESDFQTNTRSRASSAAGLYQFTRGTWMQLIKMHGANHGLGELADKIHPTGHGDYNVSDPALRQQILDLHRDPRLSALMAGEYAKDNKAWLERSLGRPVNSTDLYMAHFLGPGGAVKVLKAKAENPDQPAAALLPQAARKNPTVFYDGNHSAQSVAAVYDKIHHSLDRPMRQYAKLEETPTPSVSLDGPAVGEQVAAAAPAGDTAAPTAQTRSDSRNQTRAYDKVAAASSAAASRHQAHATTQKAQKGSEPAWPFEQAHWPPSYVPPVNPSALAATAIVDHPDDLAYTDASKSADQISAPMPPAPGLAPQDAQRAGFGKLLKDLFG